MINLATKPECQVISLGQLEYTEAWALQDQIVSARSADKTPDTLLFVEHPHTYTLGSSAHLENILFTPAELAAHRIAVHTVNRGGDVTYHGPGQLVGYPILKLAAGDDGLHADVIDYVRRLEQTLIEALASFDIVAYPYPGLTGVWLDSPDGPAKIAAIGVKVNTRRVTMHGFALNINTDLSYFKGIIPCGISDKPVTSMEQVLGHVVAMEDVSTRVASAFGTIFNRNIVEAALPTSGWSL